MIKAVIFDFDGVIVDSLKYAYENLNHILEVFGRKKVKNLEEFKSLRKKTIQDFLEKEKVNFIEKILVVIYTLILFSKHFDPPLKKGIVKILKELKKNNIRIIILSNNFKRIIKKILKKHKILKYFDKIVGISLNKEKKSRLLRILKTLKVKPEETIFITDGPDDIKSVSKIKGLITIGITDGFFNEDDIIMVEPTYYVKSNNDLYNLLLDIINNKNIRKK